MYVIPNSLRDRISVFILVISSILTFGELSGQDFHYSQFYNAPVTVNPALTGIFNGDERIMGSLRDQWRPVPVPWFNFSLSYDRKIYPKKSKKGFFGAGAFFNYDVAGDSKLQLANINLAGSYTRVLNHRNLLTIGALLGYASRGFNPDDLTWDRYWDPNTFTVDPSSGSGESFNYERFGFLESSLGLNYRWQKSSRTKLDLGIGGFHLITPKARFYENESQQLPIRFSLYGIYSRKLSDKLDLQLDGLYQKQNAYNEWLVGGYLNFYLNQNRGKEFEFRVGVGYRTRQAIYPKLGIEFKNLFIAASYDIYFDDFSQEHGGGGPEIHVRYLIRHVKPLGKFKVCPIF